MKNISRLSLLGAVLMALTVSNNVFAVVPFKSATIKPVVVTPEDVVFTLKKRLARKLAGLEKRVYCINQKALCYSNGVNLFPGGSDLLRRIQVIVKAIETGNADEVKVLFAQACADADQKTTQTEQDETFNALLAAIVKQGVDASLMLTELWITKVLHPGVTIVEQALNETIYYAKKKHATQLIIDCKAFIKNLPAVSHPIFDGRLLYSTTDKIALHKLANAAVANEAAPAA